jgi:glucokinase
MDTSAHASPAGERRVWGLDIGGTKIGVCIGNAAGEVLAGERFPAASLDPRAALEQALARLRALQALHPGEAPLALGVACPGPMSSREGRFLDPPNMPAWHRFAVREELLRLGAPHVRLMNDANAGALAESLWGAARGASTSIFFTMSTGMGAGLVIGGRLYEGPDDLAGEIGHLRLDPDGPVGFGKRGSVEGYLSGPGLVQLGEAEARIARQRGETTRLWPLTHEHPRFDAEELCRAAASGDPAAKRATDRAADALGRLMSLLTDLLNPEVFVLGTIGTAYPELFLPGARSVLEREALPRAVERVKILTSTLGAERGMKQALAAALFGYGELHAR